MAQQKPVVKKTTKPKLGGEIGRPPFDKKSPVTYLPGRKATNVPKSKNGKSFPDLNKDGKITKADILKGRGVIAKTGTSVPKKNSVSRNIGNLNKAKNGKPVKKAFLGSLLGGGAGKSMLGGIGKKMIGGLAEKALGGLMGGGGKGGMLGGLLGKNGKSVKKAKSGNSMKKCKGGC